MKKTVFLLGFIALVAIIFASSCTKDDDNNQNPTGQAPVADFTANTPLALADTDFVNLILTDKSTNSPTSLAWEVSGGNLTSPLTSSAASPTFKLTAAGTYTAKLTATNNSGSNSKELAIVVTEERIRIYGVITTHNTFFGAKVSYKYYANINFSTPNYAVYLPKKYLDETLDNLGFQVFIKEADSTINNFSISIPTFVLQQENEVNISEP